MDVVKANNPLEEQLGRFQRWAAGAFENVARGLPGGFPGAPLAPRRHALTAQQQRSSSGAERAPPAVALRRRAAPLAAIIPGDSVVEQVVATGFYNFINLYNTALIIRLVLTWFPSPPEAIVSPLATVCDPYLNLFRGVVPPLGGTLDLSPILAFLVLNVFQGTAAALPCELPPAGAPPRGSRAPNAAKQQLRAAAAPAGAVNAQPQGVWAPLSRYQLAWARRVAAQRQRRAAAAEAGARA